MGRACAREVVGPDLRPCSEEADADLSRDRQHRKGLGDADAEIRRTLGVYSHPT
jgi:hypothetical protein